MDFTRAELKAQAKEQMNGNLGKLILCYFILIAISGGAGTILGRLGAFGGVANLAVSLVITPVLSMGFVKVLLNTTYGEEPDVGTMFEGFSSNLVNIVVLNILMGIFIFLWSLLLIVPGIIMALAYSQAYRIMAENPDMAPMDCLKASKEMMNGHKADLFVLILSFIGWGLLVCITFGIASLYVTPYMGLTSTNFYHKIKEGGDGRDLGSVMSSVENAASGLNDTLDNLSDKVENVAGDIVDKIN